MRLLFLLVLFSTACAGGDRAPHFASGSQGAGMTAGSGAPPAAAADGTVAPLEPGMMVAGDAQRPAAVPGVGAGPGNAPSDSDAGPRGGPNSSSMRMDAGSLWPDGGSPASDVPQPETDSAQPSDCEDPLADIAGLPFAVEQRVDYYDFSGGTILQMRAQIDLQQPEPGYDARTGWEIAWEFDSPDNCQTVTWALKLEATYSFPRWQRPPMADAAVAATWDAYVDALWCHEYGHTEIGQRATMAAHRALTAIGPQLLGCAGLQVVADRTFDAVLQGFLDEEVQYDEDTNHGETMRARFPP